MTGLLWGFLMLLVPLQSKYAFKKFYEEGEALFEQEKYAEALEPYQEAFRLEPKAQRYREEGAFFRSYLPRYKIALCYEQIDLAEAEEWVRKSKEALEEDAIRRAREETSRYHADLERITKKVEAYRADLTARYELALRDANQLLTQNKFAEARKAYEALYQIDPSRTEATLGMDRIGPARTNYLKGLVLDARSALLAGELDRAEAFAGQVEKVDPGFSDLDPLKTEIAKAREEALKPAVKPEPQPVTVTERKKDPEPAKRDPPVTRPPDKPVQKAEPNLQVRKTQLRTELLETLKPYRRGDPEAALARLREIKSPITVDSPSYHWLRGLYLLTAYRHSAQPDDRLKKQAGEAMGRARKLSPAFEPDPAIYPAYVVQFFKTVPR